MMTRSGLIELDAGWILAVSAVGPDRIRLVLHFDPYREMPLTGIKDLPLTVSEATEIKDALSAVIDRAEEYSRMIRIGPGLPGRIQ